MIVPASAASRRLPPGPPNGWLGAAHYRAIVTDLLGFSRGLQRDYGDTSSYRIGPIRFYHFCHPDQVRELLVKQSLSLRKLTSVKQYFKRWMGDGLLLNEGAAWQVQRRKVRWALQHLNPEAQAARVLARTARELAAARDTVDLAAVMDRLAFGFNLAALIGDDAEREFDAIHAAANVLHSTGLDEMKRWSMAPDWLPTAGKRRLREALQAYRGTLLRLAAHRRAHPRPPAERDLLEWLVVARDQQGGSVGMSDRAACDEAVNLLMGGKETVAATLTWAGYLLATHPEEQELARAEVRAVLGERTAGRDDLEQLPYTTGVALESMRLYPPVYFIAREVGRPLVAGGYRLPRGAQLQIAVHLIHRDPRWFDAPDRFDPTRFEPALVAQRPMYSFMPFGAGPRACVGQRTGMSQSLLVLAQLLAGYRIDLAPGQGPPALETDIVLHPRDPLWVRLTPLGAAPPRGATL